jgi:geranylgeranyl reductase family protein
MAIRETIIVGAGPAGCGAAHRLAAAGRDVVLIDKADFPRMKACAGALTRKTIEALPFDVSPVVRRTCQKMTLSLGDQARTYGNGELVAAMMVREEFDRFCLEKCVARGAEFWGGCRVTGLARDTEGWVVTTTRGMIRGRFLIGADGANSVVRRMLVKSHPIRFGLALETCVRREGFDGEAMEFDFGAVDRGYGWVFPKDDHLNVGLYSLNPTIENADEKLTEFVRHKVGRGISGRIHGHKIPYDGRRMRNGWKNACLIGDAAGMIDPFLGEGIYHAVRGGQLAAEAIMNAGREGQADFEGAMEEIRLDLASYDSETRRFYANIHRGYRRVARTPLGGILVKGFARGWTVRRIKAGILGLVFR